MKANIEYYILILTRITISLLIDELIALSSTFAVDILRQYDLFGAFTSEHKYNWDDSKLERRRLILTDILE